MRVAELLGVGLAVLAAVANAGGSVLQRIASRNRRATGSWASVRELLARPTWTAGILAHVGGFVAQGAALGHAQISLVQPLLLLELPLTLVLSATVFRTALPRRSWASVGIMVVGLALFLYALTPSPGRPDRTPGWAWLGGIVASTAVIVVAAVFARRRRSHHRAAWFGVAAGATYGLNAALIAGAVVGLGGGLLGLLSTWQTYGVLVGGTVSFVLLQQALQAGDLVAAQPGITLTNPVLALGWGFVAFGERPAPWPWPAVALLGAAAVAAGAVGLARTALPALSEPVAVG